MEENVFLVQTMKSSPSHSLDYSQNTRAASSQDKIMLNLPLKSPYKPFLSVLLRLGLKRQSFSFAPKYIIP